MNIERSPKFIVTKNNVINGNYLMNVAYMKTETWNEEQPANAWLSFTLNTGDRLDITYGNNLTRCYNDLNKIKEFLGNEEEYLDIDGKNE